MRNYFHINVSHLQDICIFFAVSGNQPSTSELTSKCEIKCAADMNSDRKTTKVQQEIDDNLKRAYGDVTQQEVPDRFTDLLAQLRAAEAGKAEPAEGADNAEN